MITSIKGFLVCIQEGNRNPSDLSYYYPIKVVVGEKYIGEIKQTGKNYIGTFGFTPWAVHDNNENYWVIERTINDRTEYWVYSKDTFITLEEYRDILIESFIS